MSDNLLFQKATAQIRVRDFGALELQIWGESDLANRNLLIQCWKLTETNFLRVADEEFDWRDPENWWRLSRYVDLLINAKLNQRYDLPDNLRRLLRPL